MKVLTTVLGLVLAIGFASSRAEDPPAKELPTSTVMVVLAVTHNAEGSQSVKIEYKGTVLVIDSSVKVVIGDKVFLTKGWNESFKLNLVERTRAMLNSKE